MLSTFWVSRLSNVAMYARAVVDCDSACSFANFMSDSFFSSSLILRPLCPSEVVTDDVLAVMPCWCMLDGRVWMLRVLEDTVRYRDLVGGGRDRLDSVADGLRPPGVWAIMLDGSVTF